MFIKLTRFDNRPVWLNAAFIVTVEPRRDGHGAVVVPIGDGLDYDVRESPNEVLRMLDGCPAPTVVPVPVSDCLTQTPADVSPEPEAKPVVERPVVQKPAAEKPAAETPAAAMPAEAGAMDEKSAGEPSAESKSEEEVQSAEVKAKKKVTRARAKKPAAAKKEKPAKNPVLELSDEEVSRLQKLSPKSVAKLKNTLVSQFRVSDISETVAALEQKGVLTLDGNHVNWKTA